MTLYEKNLRTLSKHYPQMDQLIKEAKNNLKEEIEIIEEEATDGEKILKIKKDKQTLYLNGKRNTKEPAQMWVKLIGKREQNAPILMVGIGNATYLKELVEKTKNRITIIVYEPSLQIFLKFLEMQDLERWMEKHLIVFWVNGIKDMNTKLMKGLLENILTYEMLNYSKTFVLPNYNKLFPMETTEFVRICRDIALKEVSGYNTKNVFSNVMVKNLLLNARYLCTGYKTSQLYEVIPKTIPGILVSAGPSLNKNIDDLKEAKGKAFIIAVDTAIKPLLNAGIIPDMFAIIDAMKPLDLVKIEQARNIPLVTTLNAASEVLDYHTGMKFFYNEGIQFAERIFLKTGYGVSTVACGGSVATNAFSLLYKMGIDTIILVGQDLAYTNNKSHADGTFKEVMDQEDTSNFRMVEGNIEEKVPTRNDFKIFIDWFNNYIKGCKEYREKFRVINATEGGAKIENTEIMTLKEAIKQVCIEEVNVQDRLQKLEPMLNVQGREWAENYLIGLSEEFKKLASELRRIYGTYEKLDKICNKKNINKKEFLNILHKLDKQIKEVEKKSTYQLVGITMANAEYILRNEQFQYENSVQKEGKEIARKGLLFMKNAENMAKVFSEYANEIFSDLKK